MPCAQITRIQKLGALFFWQASTRKTPCVQGPDAEKSRGVPTCYLDLEAAATDFPLMFVRCKKRFKDGKEHRYGAWSKTAA